MDLILLLKPMSVLDIGAGFGKYGFLCREYLELWDGRQEYSDFRRRIDAVEAFPQYITPIHRFVYDNIYEDDILNVADKISFRYDLVLIIDVLEHFDKATGQSLLQQLLAKHKGVLVSTPKNPSKQLDAFGNEYERHKSRWDKNELRGFGNALFINDRVSHICYITCKEKIQRLERKLLVKKIIEKPGGSSTIRVLVRLRDKYRRMSKSKDNRRSYTLENTT